MPLISKTGTTIRDIAYITASLVEDVLFKDV